MNLNAHPAKDPVQPGSSSTISLRVKAIWIICAGVPLAVNFAFVGFVYSITLVGIPLGFTYLRLASYLLLPFGRVVIEAPKGDRDYRDIGNLVWCVSLIPAIGWFAGLSLLITGLLAVTFVGLQLIPFLRQVLSFVFRPYGKQITSFSALGTTGGGSVVVSIDDSIAAFLKERVNRKQLKEADRVRREEERDEVLRKAEEARERERQELLLEERRRNQEHLRKKREEEIRLQRELEKRREAAWLREVAPPFFRDVFPPTKIRMPQDADDFETVSCEFARKIGFPDANRTPKGPDKGIDVFAEGMVGQAKMHPSQKVTGEMVRALAGSKLEKKAKHALFFHYGPGYSKDAIEAAKATGVRLFQLNAGNSTMSEIK